MLGSRPRTSLVMAALMGGSKVGIFSYGNEFKARAIALNPAAAACDPN